MERIFATPIRMLMEKMKISQHKLAQMTGMTQPHFSKIADGAYWPTKRSLALIGKALGITPKEFWMFFINYLLSMPESFWDSATWDDLLPLE